MNWRMYSKVIIIILMVFNGWLNAQDPVFSQFYNTPTSINPGFTGSFEAPLVAINYRNQWPSISKAYSTYSVSYDQFFNEYNSGFGLSLLTDDAGAGAMKTHSATLKYSYSLRFNGDYRLKLGLEAGMIQTNMDWSRFVFGDNLDPQHGALSPGGTPYPTAESLPDELTRTNLDLSTGLLLHSDKFYVGLSFKHFNNPDLKVTSHSNRVQDIGLPMRWSIHGGTTYTIREQYKEDEGVFIAPYTMLSVQGDFFQVNVGAYAQISQFLTSLSFRYTSSNFDALILAAGWKYDMYKIMYSYDYTLSDLGISSGGAHELGIIINFDKIYSSKSRYPVECFEVFR